MNHETQAFNNQSLRQFRNRSLNNQTPDYGALTAADGEQNVKAHHKYEPGMFLVDVIPPNRRSKAISQLIS